jgi:hypothetical protein
MSIVEAPTQHATNEVTAILPLLPGTVRLWSMDGSSVPKVGP